MKKLLSALLVIPTLYLVLWLLPAAFKFASWLFILDNTDFGLPWWLDLLIDSIAGCLAFALIKTLFTTFRIHDRESRDYLENIVGILIGFVIALIVHTIMEYWYIVLIVFVLIIGLIVFIVIRNNKKEK